MTQISLIYIYVYPHVQECISVQMYVNVYRRLEGGPGVVTKATSLSSIGTESLTTLELAQKIARLTSEPQGSTLFCFSSTEVASERTCAWIFNIDSEGQIQVVLLASHLSHFPSLYCFLISFQQFHQCHRLCYRELATFPQVELFIPVQ